MWWSPPRRPWRGRAAPSCASTGSTPRPWQASSGAPSLPPGSARRCSRSISSPRCRPPSTAPSPRARTSARSSASCSFYARACLDRGVTPLIENVPPVLRMRTRRRLPLAGRRPLARPARVAPARPGARLHARHVARRAVPQLRRRPIRRCSASSPPTTSSSSATSRSSGPPPRWRTSPTPTACSARACHTAAASLRSSTRWCGGSASSCPTSSPRSTSPTPRARRLMKAGYREVERALAAAGGRPRRAAAAPPAQGRLRLAGGARPPRPGARRARAAGAVRRPARADHGRRRLDRPRHSPRCSSASGRRRSRCSTPTRRH